MGGGNESPNENMDETIFTSTVRRNIASSSGSYYREPSAAGGGGGGGGGGEGDRQNLEKIERSYQLRTDDLVYVTDVQKDSIYDDKLFDIPQAKRYFRVLDNDSDYFTLQIGPKNNDIMKVKFDRLNKYITIWKVVDETLLCYICFASVSTDISVKLCESFLCRHVCCTRHFDETSEEMLEKGRQRVNTKQRIVDQHAEAKAKYIYFCKSYGFRDNGHSLTAQVIDEMGPKCPFCSRYTSISWSEFEAKLKAPKTEESFVKSQRQYRPKAFAAFDSHTSVHDERTDLHNLGINRNKETIIASPTAAVSTEGVSSDSMDVDDSLPYSHIDQDLPVNLSSSSRLAKKDEVNTYYRHEDDQSNKKMILNHLPLAIRKWLIQVVATFDADYQIPPDLSWTAIYNMPQSAFIKLENKREELSEEIQAKIFELRDHQTSTTSDQMESNNTTPVMNEMEQPVPQRQEVEAVAQAQTSRATEDSHESLHIRICQVHDPHYLIPFHISSRIEYRNLLRACCKQFKNDDDVVDDDGTHWEEMQLFQRLPDGYHRKVEELFTSSSAFIITSIQQHNIFELRKIQFAMLGGKFPLQDIADNERFNRTIQSKIYTMLAWGYRGYREVRGDGNCYYRAIIVSAIEVMISHPQRKIFFIQLLQFCREVIYQHHEDSRRHQKLITCLEAARDNQQWRTFEDFQASMISEESEIDHALIMLAKKLVVQYMLRHKDEEFNGLSLEQAVLYSNVQYDSLTKYCRAEVLAMDICAEGVHVDVGLLPALIGFTNDIVILDRNVDTTSPIVRNCNMKVRGEHEFGKIYLLLRPGHYDILYVGETDTTVNIEMSGEKEMATTNSAKNATGPFSDVDGVQENNKMEIGEYVIVEASSLPLPQLNSCNITKQDIDNHDHQQQIIISPSSNTADESIAHESIEEMLLNEAIERDSRIDTVENRRFIEDLKSAGFDINVIIHAWFDGTSCPISFRIWKIRCESLVPSSIPAVKLDVSTPKIDTSSLSNNRSEDELLRDAMKDNVLLSFDKYQLMISELRELGFSIEVILKAWKSRNCNNVDSWMEACLQVTLPEKPSSMSTFRNTADSRTTESESVTISSGSSNNVNMTTTSNKEIAIREIFKTIESRKILSRGSTYLPRQSFQDIPSLIKVLELDEVIQILKKADVWEEALRYKNQSFRDLLLDLVSE